MESGGPRIAVVGGGIAGLSAAYQLGRLSDEEGFPLDIDLYEASDRLGGAINTIREGPFMLDAGPDSLLTTKPWAIELCRELGLGDELIPTDEKNRGVALFSRGKLRPLMYGRRAPASVMAWRFLTSGTLSLPGLMRMGIDFVLPRSEVRGEESMADFFGRRLGSEAVERLIDPFMAGIYGGDPNRLSMPATFPRFLELQKKHRSMLVAILKRRKEEERAGPLFCSLKAGLGQLVERLCAKLGGTTAVQTSNPIASLRCAGDGYELKAASGETRNYAAVILAVPAHAAASILGELSPRVSEGLGAVRYVSSATLFFGFKLDQLGERPHGYGFLVPRCERRRINGATWVSNKYPGRAPDDAFLARCYVGGDRTPGQLAADDGALTRACLEELRDIALIDAPPNMTRVFRWNRSNPQYDVGHAERVEKIEAALGEHRGLWLTGSGYRGIGIPDCVRDGRETAKLAFAFMKERAAV